MRRQSVALQQKFFVCRLNASFNGSKGIGSFQMSDAATILAEKLVGIEAKLDEAKEEREAFRAELQKASTTPINKAPFSIRTGEDPLTSRRYSLVKLVHALLSSQSGMPDWSHAKVEAELHGELAKRWDARYEGRDSKAILIPLGSAELPFETSFKKQVAEMLPCVGDPDRMARLQKDLATSTDTLGGTLVGLPSQGEIIMFLRASTVLDRAGALQQTLPPSGSIRFPRFTSDATVTGTAEGGTITESTPGTGEVTATAKSYRALIDLTDQWLRFAMDGSGEAILRSELAPSQLARSLRRCRQRPSPVRFRPS